MLDDKDGQDEEGKHDIGWLMLLNEGEGCEVDIGCSSYGSSCSNSSGTTEVKTSMGSETGRRLHGYYNRAQHQ